MNTISACADVVPIAYITVVAVNHLSCAWRHKSRSVSVWDAFGSRKIVSIISWFMGCFWVGVFNLFGVESLSFDTVMMWVMFCPWPARFDRPLFRRPLWTPLDPLDLPWTLLGPLLDPSSSSASASRGVGAGTGFYAIFIFILLKSIVIIILVVVVIIISSFALSSNLFVPAIIVISSSV